MEITYPVIHIAVNKHLSPPLPAHIRRHLLELARRRLLLDLDGLLSDLVREQPRRILPPSQHELRIRLLRIYNRLLHFDMNRRLDRTHEPRPHVDALRAQTECRRETLAVREAPRRNEGDAEGLARSTQEDEVRNVRFADVTRTFEAVDGEEVDAQLDGGLGVADGSAFVEDDAVRGLELLDDRTGAVSCRLDDSDAFLDDDARVAGVVGWDQRGEECEVDAEGVLGHGPTSSDLLAEVFG